MKKIAAFSICVALSSLTMAFSCGGGNPNAGFKVQVIVTSNGVDFQQTGHLVADFLSPNGTTSGTITHFDQDVGFTQLSGAKVPGRWRFTITFFTCFFFPNTQVEERNVNLNDVVPLRCISNSAGNFTASPNPVDAFNPPATGTIYGQGISTTYGMPIVQYYDAAGILVGEQAATSVAGDGTWLQGPVPDLTSAISGTYTILVNNRRSDASLYILGSATVNVQANDPPPPDPGGGGCRTRPCPQSPTY